MGILLLSSVLAVKGDVGLDFRPEPPTVTSGGNYSINVNQSDFWDLLDTPADLLLSMFSGSWIDTTIQMLGNDIDFFGGNIENVSHIQFNPAGNGCTDEFCLEVDADMGKLIYSLPGGNVVNSIGFESYFGDGRVRNTETFTIENCKAVWFTESTGQIPEVQLTGIDEGYRIAQAIVGISTEQILSNQLGYVTSYGIVRECNTSAFNDGDSLFLDSEGTFTNIPPSGNGTIFIGTDKILKI
jgi:hypothetical protein